MGGMSRTGRGRERGAGGDRGRSGVPKSGWVLPVVAEFGRRLRIAEIVDQLCPVRPVAWITHGEVIEALVANRLTAPALMLRVHEWAAAMVVEEAYGIAPELLNDDRIARALDAVAPQLDAITGSVGAAAVSEFGVDVSRLHWDSTSISLYGAYPEADEEYPAPRWGASQGPAGRSEADPDRAGGQQRWCIRCSTRPMTAGPRRWPRWWGR